MRLNRNAVPHMRNSLHSIASGILPDLQKHSPVDSGEYSSNWKLEKARLGNSFSVNGQKLLASVTIINRTDYAYFMEYGAGIGAAPWYFTGEYTSKEAPKKLKVAAYNDGVGRVWAGGIKPGHNKTVGGALSVVLLDDTLRVDRICNIIADQYIKSFI